MLNLQGRLLVVGDDQELLELLIKILRRKGCQVTAATTGTALEMIGSNDYGRVLVDWVTDHKRRREFQKVIVSLARQLPIVLFTDVVSGEEKELARIGVGDTIYPMVTFDSLVRQVLDGVSSKTPEATPKRR